MKNLYSAVVLILLAGVSVFAQQTQPVTIDTFPQWNGTTFISSFGVVDTATYGQTFSINTSTGTLTSFSVQIGNCTAAVTFRGHVYRFNGTMATGPSLFDSAPQTVPADAVFHLVTFATGNVPLTTGQYVLFASTSEDQAAAPNSACRWGAITNNNGVPGGQFVFINNGPNPAQWTTNTWSNIGEDLAIQIGLVLPVPTLSQWGMILLASLLVAAGYFTLRSRRRLQS